MIPREDSYDVADLRPIAVAVSRLLGCAVLTSVVFDSDLVECWVYRDGERVHRYMSEVGAAVEWFEDDDGEFKASFDGVVIADGEPVPQRPLGVDAAAFTSFVDGTPDTEQIEAALRGAEDRLPAELQHRVIIESLGLPPEALTLGARHVDLRRFPAAHVCAVSR
ncbi:hypothetical protein [Dactylosporangium sp. NPDC000521]|uniref:hypothetical protein n=1 Tax=Dactylosporangium sp. NPDC000521 TaxID=3363975 RepID=UPI00368B0F9A